MTNRGRVLSSNSDLGLVNHHHNEFASERTLVRRDKLAMEILGGCLNDFYRAACNRNFILIGKLCFL